MDRFFGLIGIAVILLIAFLMSNNRKAINYRLVVSGLLLQIVLAVFILKVPFGQLLFSKIGFGITKLLDYATMGGNFVFGILMDDKALSSVFGIGKGFIFMFKLVPTIILVSVLVSGRGTDPD